MKQSKKTAGKTATAKGARAPRNEEAEIKAELAINDANEAKYRLTERQMRRKAALCYDLRNNYRSELEDFKRYYNMAYKVVCEYEGAFSRAYLDGDIVPTKAQWFAFECLNNGLFDVLKNWTWEGGVAERILADITDADGVPYGPVQIDLIQGLAFLRDNVKPLWDVLVAADRSLGPAIQMSGNAFAKPSLLMRTAIMATEAAFPAVGIAA